MGELDPTDPAAVGAALATWVADELATPAVPARPPERVEGGFDSHLHAVWLGGDGLAGPWAEPLVVRIVPTADRADQARREAAAQRWAAARGVAAPAVLAVFDAGPPFGLPAQVMARVPGTTMLAAASARPWRFGRHIDHLAELALRLHALPVADWPGPADPGALADQRLRLPREIVERTGDADLAGALRRVEALDPGALHGDDPVVCHGDLHPLNVMVDGDRSWVLDWTDAGLGPPEADVVRTALLLEVVAPLAASRRWERAALGRVGPLLARRFLRSYTAGRPLDGDRLRRWEALHALHGWSQILALHAGAFAGRSSAEDRQGDVPLALAGALRARVEAVLAEVGG